MKKLLILLFILMVACTGKHKNTNRDVGILPLVNVGTSPNSGTGDPLQNAFIKVNSAIEALNTVGIPGVISKMVTTTNGLAFLNENGDTIAVTNPQQSYGYIDDYAVMKDDSITDKLYATRKYARDVGGGTPTLSIYRMNNDHDSLNTLQEKSYNSLTDKPILTIYRQNNDHDSLNTLQEKSYNSLNDKPTLTVYRQNNDHDSLSTLQEKAYSSLSGKPTLGTAATQDVGYFATASHNQAQTTVTALPDSLLNHYTKAQSNAKYGTGSGTVTSVGTGLGLSGGTITTTGTLLVDTASAVILTRLRASHEYQAKGSYVGKATMPTSIGIACSDETTALTAGAAKVTFRMPYAMTVTGVRAGVTTAATGGTLLTVDIHESGTTILSTKLTFDASEYTTTTAATAAVISDAAIADDAQITIDIDAVGSTIAGAGLKVWIIGTRIAP